MKTCILVGGGYSVKEGIALGLWDKIKHKEVWSINYAFMTMPFLPARELWVDVSFFKNNTPKLQELSQKGVQCYAKHHVKYALIPEIKTYYTTREVKDEKEKMFLGKMGLSGLFALSMAVKEHYDIIYLLGYDFGSISNTEKTHYYQEELKVISTGVGKKELYVHNDVTKNEVKDFEIYLTYPSKIINVSPLSRIPYFEKISYEEFFNRIKEQ